MWQHYLPTYLTTKLKYLTTYRRPLLGKQTVPQLKSPHLTAIRCSQQWTSEYHTNCAAIMPYSLCGTQKFTAMNIWVPQKLCSYYAVQFVWYSEVHSNEPLSTTQTVQLLCCTVLLQIAYYLTLFCSHQCILMLPRVIPREDSQAEPPKIQPHLSHGSINMCLW